MIKTIAPNIKQDLIKSLFGNTYKKLTKAQIERIAAGKTLDIIYDRLSPEKAELLQALVRARGFVGSMGYIPDSLQME